MQKAKTKTLKSRKEAVTDNRETGSFKLFIRRLSVKEVATMSKIDERVKRPLLNCVISSCEGISMTKQRNEGNRWIDAKGENIDDKGIGDDHYRKRTFLLPNFGKCVEKEDKPSLTARTLIENTTDVVSLPKLENKVLQKETKRRATPFEKAQKYEIKKWLDGVMLHIEEEQCKLNMDDKPFYQRTPAPGSSSKVLTRRRSMLNLGEIAGESTDYVTETNRDLPRLRAHSTNTPKLRPKLHKIHSDSNIKNFWSST